MKMSEFIKRFEMGEDAILNSNYKEIYLEFLKEKGIEI